MINKMNDDRLREFSDQHLTYEIHSLFSALELFANQRIDPHNFLTLYARNLFFEGVIVHSRTLYEFLYFGVGKSPKRADDALAIHYFDSAAMWESVRPAISTHFKDMYERAGKEIVHLTYTRLGKTEIERRWNFYLLAKDLLKALKLFVENAEARKIHPNVKKDLEFWGKRISPILAGPDKN